MVRAVVLDVGGTLWPDRWPEASSDEGERVAALRQLEPAIREDQAQAIVATLSAWRHPASREQQTLSVVQEAVARAAPKSGINHWNVVRAMCLPAQGKVALFDGARELLHDLAKERVRVVIATNVIWRTATDQYRDLSDAGVDTCVSACVTSLDVGWRKPHRHFFNAVLHAVEYPAAECAMVGDSEVNDIQPARDLGMMTVKVVQEIDRARPSAADDVCESLAGVRAVILDHLSDRS